MLLLLVLSCLYPNFAICIFSPQLCRCMRNFNPDKLPSLAVLLLHMAVCLSSRAALANVGIHTYVHVYMSWIISLRN